MQTIASNLDASVEKKFGYRLVMEKEEMQKMCCSIPQGNLTVTWKNELTARNELFEYSTDWSDQDFPGSVRDFGQGECVFHIFTLIKQN